MTNDLGKDLTDEQLSVVLRIMDETSHENYTLAYPCKPGDDMVMLFPGGNVTIKADGTESFSRRQMCRDL